MPVTILMEMDIEFGFILQLWRVSNSVLGFDSNFPCSFGLDSLIDLGEAPFIDFADDFELATDILQL